MSLFRHASLRGLALSFVATGLLVSSAHAVSAQRRTPPPRTAPPHPAPTPRRQPPHARPPLRSTIFIGGYFYDPIWGPYPWWPPDRYRYPYVPYFGRRSDLRLVVTPKTASVYVDGFYAGIVDQFDGVFQSLALTPGGHTVALYEPGFATDERRVYLSPGGTLTLRLMLRPLPPGETSAPPQVAPMPPAPPEGSYRLPEGTRPPFDVAPDHQ